ncbi:hypothetical protein FOZ61_003342, partial [Perkinsus olseni]
YGCPVMNINGDDDDDDDDIEMRFWLSREEGQLDYNAKNMIESSRRLQEGGDVSLLRDKSLLQIPVMEVREIEAGLLVQLIHTIQDYIAIIDHDVYDNIGDDVNGDSGHVLSVSSYQDNGDDKTVDDDNNRRTKKGSNDSNKNRNNNKPTK